MSMIRPGLVLPALLAGLFAGATAQPLPAVGNTKAVPYTPEFHFDLVPKAFRANPTLEMTVFTEMTDYGRTFAPATPEAPVYYTAQDSGEQSRGFASSGEHGPSKEQLTGVVVHSLEAGGYLPAGEAHRPTVALVYYWGAHNRNDPDLARKFPDLARQYVLERAVLVGGKAYMLKLKRGFDYGDMDLAPDSKTIFLKEQAVDDLYYVVVSAYAYDDLVRKERRLLWRTTMTVNSRGVSMTESLPPLIVTAGDYFGRETAEPMALRRAVQRGTVKLGPMSVIESDVKVTPPAPAAATQVSLPATEPA